MCFNKRIANNFTHSILFDSPNRKTRSKKEESPRGYTLETSLKDAIGTGTGIGIGTGTGIDTDTDTDSDTETDTCRHDMTVDSSESTNGSTKTRDKSHDDKKRSFGY